MCLLALQFNPSSTYPLWLISHRDEQFSRQSQSLHYWPEVPCLAGKDLAAGGTWLGFQGTGRFAAITNRPDVPIPAHARSRGELVIEYLHSNVSPSHYATALLNRTHLYAGFNLIVGSLDEALLVSSDTHTPQTLLPGIHVISNNPPNQSWPKIQTALTRMDSLKSTPVLTPELLLPVLDDRPPVHPYPPIHLQTDYAKQLFIMGNHYGTRAITSAVYSNHQFSVIEQTFGPLGQPVQQTACTII